MNTTIIEQIEHCGNTSETRLVASTVFSCLQELDDYNLHLLMPIVKQRLADTDIKIPHLREEISKILYEAKDLSEKQMIAEEMKTSPPLQD